MKKIATIFTIASLLFSTSYAVTLPENYNNKIDNIYLGMKKSHIKTKNKGTQTVISDISIYLCESHWIGKDSCYIMKVDPYMSANDSHDQAKIADLLASNNFKYDSSVDTSHLQSVDKRSVYSSRLDRYLNSGKVSINSNIEAMAYKNTDTSNDQYIGLTVYAKNPTVYKGSMLFQSITKSAFSFGTPNEIIKNTEADNKTILDKTGGAVHGSASSIYNGVGWVVSIPYNSYVVMHGVVATFYFTTAVALGIVTFGLSYAVFGYGKGSVDMIDHGPKIKNILATY